MSAEHVTRMKVQKSLGFTIAQNGTNSDGGCQKLSESRSKNENLKRRSGNGKEVLSRILLVKANGTEAISG